MPGSHRILVVDDNAVTRYSVRRVLEHHQFVVEEAGTGTDGLAKLATHAFAAVVLDVNLPDMSGFDIVRSLRAARAPRCCRWCMCRPLRSPPATWPPGWMPVPMRT